MELLKHPDKKRIQEDKGYLRMMSMSYALLEEKEVKKEELQKAIEEIKRANGR